MNDAERAPRPDPIDDVADSLHARFNALEPRLDNIEKSLAHIAEALRERLPSPGATDDLAAELTIERGNRRNLEARVDHLESVLGAAMRSLGITIR